MYPSSQTKYNGVTLLFVALLREMDVWQGRRTPIDVSNVTPSEAQPQIDPKILAAQQQIDKPRIELAQINNIAQYSIRSLDREKQALEYAGIPFYHREYPKQLPHRLKASALRFYNDVLRNPDGRIPGSIMAQIQELSANLQHTEMRETDTAALIAFTDVLTRLDQQSRVPFFQKVLNKLGLNRPESQEKSNEVAPTAPDQHSMPINLNSSAVTRVEELYRNIKLGLNQKIS